MLSKLFDDKRMICVVLITWMATVICIFSSLGLMKTQFMSIGPSEKTFFMGLKLHTWGRWSLVAIFTFVSTAINDFVGDAIVPWIQNTVQDHKSRYIPYSPMVCWFITQCWAIYCCTMGIFSIYLLMSQVDFLIIRATADAIVNTYTTFKFLKGKKTNIQKYYEYNGPNNIHDFETDTECSSNTSMCRPVCKSEDCDNGYENSDECAPRVDARMAPLVEAACHAVMRDGCMRDGCAAGQPAVK